MADDTDTSYGEHADPFAQWDVRLEHVAGHTHDMLSRLAMRRAGIVWDEIEDQMLDEWLEDRREEGTVVDYDPEHPGGFFFVHARPGIDTDVVRRADR